LQSPLSVVKDTDYWLTLHGSTAVEQVYAINSRMTSGSTDQLALASDTFADGLSDPFGTVSVSQDYQASFYALIQLRPVKCLRLIPLTNLGGRSLRFSEHASNPSEYFTLELSSSDGTQDHKIEWEVSAE